MYTIFGKPILLLCIVSIEKYRVDVILRLCIEFQYRLSHHYNFFINLLEIDMVKEEDTQLGVKYSSTKRAM